MASFLNKKEDQLSIELLQDEKEESKVNRSEFKQENVGLLYLSSPKTGKIIA
jgi:hypothetical protein